MMDPLDALLASVPFDGLDRQARVRLIGALERRDASPGELIIREGDPADALYLLEQGSVEVSIATPEGDRVVGTQDAPASFGELGLVVGQRTSSVRALTEVRLWRLPRERLMPLLRDQPALSTGIATSALKLLERRQRERLGAPPLEIRASWLLPIEVGRAHASQRRRYVGGAVSLGLLVALWPFVPAGFDDRSWHGLLIVLAAGTAWLIEPVPHFVVALGMAGAWVAGGVVPAHIAFGGFATGTWILAVVAFAVAGAASASGLLLRIALGLTRSLPPTHTAQLVALLLGGLLVTPLVPLGLARVAAAAPLAEELVRILRYPARSPASAGIVFAALAGYGLFSNVFLTGFITNFVLIELLGPTDDQLSDWISWAGAALPFAAILFAGTLVGLRVTFPPRTSRTADREAIRQQTRVLGPLSADERWTLVASTILIGGLALAPTIALDHAPVAVVALLPLALGPLRGQRLRSTIDWGFLLFIGVLLGAPAVLGEVGLDRRLAEALSPVARAIDEPAVLVLGLALVVMLSRVVLPWLPTMLLLLIALVPVATRLGLHGWIIGFVIMVSVTTWLVPGQSDYVRLMRDGTTEELFSDAQAYAAGALISLVTLVGIAASIPFWKVLGLL